MFGISRPAYYISFHFNIKIIILYCTRTSFLSGFFLMKTALIILPQIFLVDPSYYLYKYIYMKKLKTDVPLCTDFRRTKMKFIVAAPVAFFLMEQPQPFHYLTEMIQKEISVIMSKYNVFLSFFLRSKMSFPPGCFCDWHWVGTARSDYANFRCKSRGSQSHTASTVISEFIRGIRNLRTNYQEQWEDRGKAGS